MPLNQTFRENPPFATAAIISIFNCTAIFSLQIALQSMSEMLFRQNFPQLCFSPFILLIPYQMALVVESGSLE
jgi:hypothetical protein